MLEEERNRIETEHFTLGILNGEKDFCCDEIACFDCDNNDLNEFFQKDAFAHKQHLLAETYFFQPREATEEEIFFPVALISFLNDAIVIEKEERKGEKKGFWDYLRKNVPHEKRGYPSFPAVKIGRLGVQKEYQRLHFGTSLLNMTKDLFLTNNRTGCRFITVDAENNEATITFYKKNGFDFLWDKDSSSTTRIMFFDLKRHESNGQISFI
jgi:GNAT superfamily N-acetyltransferase